MRQNLFFVGLLVVLFFMPMHPAYADGPTLARLKQILADLPPLSGRFLQFDPQIGVQGGVLTGRFYLDLPQRAKFIYDAPASSVITLRGNWLSVQEAPGGEANNFPVGSSPLALLRDGVRGLTHEHIAVMRDGDGEIEIDLSDPTCETPGRLALQFALPAWQLLGWRATDVQNNVTQVTLSDYKTHKSLPKALFFVQEDEPNE